MRKVSLFAVFTVLAAFTAASAVQITFVGNTATVPDTMGPNSVVQMRGDDGVAGGLEWDGTSEVFLHNVGGDYWEGSWDFAAGSNIQYKFFTNASHDTVYGGAEWEHQGWEGDPNRTLTVPDDATVLPLQFVYGTFSGDPEATPWEDVEGTFAVWVRVNMQGWEDLSPTHQVGIRGSNYVDWGQTGELSWGCTHWLSPEPDHVNGGSQQYSGRFLYSGAIHVPDTYAGAGIEFKVVVHNAGAPCEEDWGDMVYNPSQQQLRIDLTGADTTLHWFWFDNLRPVTAIHEDEVIVRFEADMSNAIANNGFAHGQPLVVNCGYYGTASEVYAATMTRQGFTNIYAATDTIMTTIGEFLDYQYYKNVNDIDYREIYYNFYYTGLTAGEAERRVYDPVEGNNIVIQDIVDSEDDVHRMPLFRNTSVIAMDVRVTFTCDVRPAIYQVAVGSTLYDIQGSLDISNPDDVIAYGVAMNGPATEFGWSNGEGFSDWGAHLMTLDYKRMVDDGTNGDETAGDSIYTRIESYFVDSSDVVGQEFKFGVNGGDNEGGYGNNHIENINDSQAESQVDAQFGDIAPPQYWTWDFNAKRPWLKGDANLDHAVDILDVLHVVNIILATEPDPTTLPGIWTADCNEDGAWDVLDALGIVNVVLGIGTCPPAAAKLEVSAEAMKFLQSLADYMAPEDFSRFMALVKAEIGMPGEYSLAQNYPNPFNPETSIAYALPLSGKVKLSVFNVLGQEVKVLVDSQMEAGFHSVTFDGSDMASGIYFYRLQTDNSVMTRKMVLMK
ncbi:MAG: T9SS type A sorting domain-containing protein [Gemmatimonadota bacterium]|nr:MAG: T9SS type A sorting domain-containing protein [Gemmatimonadota bacterium]